MNESETNNSVEIKNSENGVGPIIASIIIILIIVAGAFYLFSTIKEKRIPIQNQNTSDEVFDIEAELESTELENLDAELEAIESEF
jgi:uncharacterized protein HemX